MATAGKVRVWDDEDGWGVVDSASTPGGCWTHFSHVAAPGFRSLRPGQLVELEWEPAQQDGYAFRAIRVWPRGEQPYEAPADSVSTDGSGAFHSTLTITMDEPPPPTGRSRHHHLMDAGEIEQAVRDAVGADVVIVTTPFPSGAWSIDVRETGNVLTVEGLPTGEWGASVNPEPDFRGHDHVAETLPAVLEAARPEWRRLPGSDA